MPHGSVALLALASAVLLGIAGCGGTDHGDALASAICDRWSRCGDLGEPEYEDCVDGTRTWISDDLCPTGWTPTAAYLDRCRTFVDTASCASLDRGEVCPAPECRADTAGSPFFRSGDGGPPAATDFYFSGYEPLDLPPCSDAPLPRIGGRADVGLVHGPGLTDEDVAWHTRGLQRFYAPYELRFEAAGPLRSIDDSAIIVATDQDVEQALLAAGIPLDRDLTDEETERAIDAVLEVLFRPLRRFMNAESIPAAERVDVVVLPQVVGPGFAQQLLSGGVAGLGLSPAVLERLAESDAGDADLFYAEVLGLDEPFTPVVFLAHELIVAAIPTPDPIVAHEVGHALGLLHEPDRANLMYAAVGDDCVPVLTSDQTGSLVGVRRGALSAGPEVLEPGALYRRARSGARRWLEQRRGGTAP